MDAAAPPTDAFTAAMIPAGEHFCKQTNAGEVLWQQGYETMNPFVVGPCFKVQGRVVMGNGKPGFGTMQTGAPMSRLRSSCRNTRRR
jgi:hypothetical protein